MISWISTPTAEGTLYDVDLRLRPEGKAGAIATSLDRLVTYFERDAWVWERLALTKARPIAGDAGLNDNIQKFINGIVQHNHPQDSLITAVADMRKRLRKQQKPAAKASKWQLRQIDGGLSDIDLLIQAWRLQHGALFSGSGQSPADILQRLHARQVIDDRQFEQMMHASQCLNEIHHSLRLTLGPIAPATDILPPGLQTFMLHVMDIADETQFQHHFDQSVSAVIDCIERYLTPAQKSS